LVRPISGVTLGNIVAREAFTVGHGRDVLGLHPGLVKAEYPIGETPQLAATFIRQFLDVRGDFPLEFHTIGDGSTLPTKHGGGKMVGFALAEFEDLLLQTGLYGAVRAVQYNILQSTQYFYAILERYNPETCTFFTLIGKIGLALYEMYKDLGLVIGDAPYEEYVSSTEELHLLKKNDPLV